MGSWILLDWWVLAGTAQRHLALGFQVRDRLLAVVGSEPFFEVAMAPGVAGTIAQQLRRPVVRDERGVAFQLLFARHSGKVALDEARRFQGAAGICGVDLKNVVLDPGIVERQVKGLHCIAHVGDGPQQVARRRGTWTGPSRCTNAP